MYGVRHALAAEFPHFRHAIHRLKHEDPEFARLLAEYDATDKRIYGLERRGLPLPHPQLAALKRRRVALKDRLYRRIDEALGARGP
ncbi:MAG: DUF465 domain-containing protein [Gammaproteobacteria bacterium]|nr:MAG: DUF465 domain-containing protein [Gammaproteobacteria bacterium]